MHTNDPAYYRDMISRITETEDGVPDLAGMHRRRTMRMLTPGELPSWFGYLDKIMLTSMTFRVKPPEDPVVTEIVWNVHPDAHDVMVTGPYAQGREHSKASDSQYFRTKEFDRLVDRTMHAVFGRGFGRFKVGEISPPPWLSAEMSNRDWMNYVESTIMHLQPALFMATSSGTARTMLLRAAAAHKGGTNLT